MRAQWTVNGGRRAFDLDPGQLLADTLRNECGLASVHLGCTDGTCGGCTVLVDDVAIRSCLMLSVQSDGAEVRTVEGLPRDHPLRTVLSATGNSPCAAGLMMLATGAANGDLTADPGALRRLLASNTCRCHDHEATVQAVIGAVAPRRTAS